MSQPSSSSFLRLFHAALQDYEIQTGTKLVEHSLAKQFETCDSVDSITAILQEQAQIFREFRGDDGKLIKSLECSVDVLYSLSVSTILGEGIGLAFPPVKAIFAGIAILLASVKDISASYNTLVDLFASFDSFLSRLSIYIGVPPTPALTNVLVKILVELISTLALATKQVKRGRFKKFMKKLRGENSIEAALQKLDRLTLDEVRATAAQTLGVVNKAERDKVLRNVKKWLSPPDPWKNHNLAHESRHSGSGTWWIQGDTYAEWKSSAPSSLLWINGKPGAGKSVICSTIIEDIRTLQKSGLASLAFFYCDFREDQKKDLRGLLSSLLVQLSEQSDPYAAILSDFYVVHGDGSHHASDKELKECLKDMLKVPGQATVYIIIDALDECPIITGLLSPREKILELVEELVNLNLHIPNLRICVTSRLEADIVPALEPLTFRSISLHGESGQVQDIAEYVRSFIYTNHEMRRWKDADKQLVIDELIKKADGMFRWVFCQLLYLRRCIPGRVRHALNELPETLDETYARTLEDIDKQNWRYAHRLFQCVSAVSRPLYVNELAEFLAFDFEAGSTPTFLADWRPEDPAHTVLSICSSLLVVVKLRDGPPVVQFAHFSVKEYLTSARLSEAKDTISRFHVSMTPAHTVVAQACLGVLLHLDKDITKDDLKKFPLVEYAAEHLVDHARFENVSSKVQDSMKCLFDPNESHLSVWVWIYDPTGQCRSLQYLFQPDTRAMGFTPLHFAAFYGLHDVAAFLIVERSQDLNTSGFSCETPLHMASYRGHCDIVQLLLEHGANAKAREIWGRTPFVLALEGGHAEVTRVFLEHGADVNAKHEDRWSSLTPLERASRYGNAKVIQVLLEHGANAKTQNEYNKTPLHFAVQEEVALLLLKHGGDANALDDGGRTPLHLASNFGRVGVARVLLEHGVDAGSRDANNATPLHLASGVDDPVLRIFGDHLGVVRLLLQYNSDVHARDDEGRTPFMRATRYEHHDISRLLSEHGAEDHRM